MSGRGKRRDRASLVVTGTPKVAMAVSTPMFVYELFDYFKSGDEESLEPLREQYQKVFDWAEQFRPSL
jgi:hypothetical protein